MTTGTTVVDRATGFITRSKKNLIRLLNLTARRPPPKDCRRLSDVCRPTHPPATHAQACTTCDLGLYDCMGGFKGKIYRALRFIGRVFSGGWVGRFEVWLSGGVSWVSVRPAVDGVGRRVGARVGAAGSAAGAFDDGVGDPRDVLRCVRVPP